MEKVALCVSQDRNGDVMFTVVNLFYKRKINITLYWDSTDLYIFMAAESDWLGGMGITSCRVAIDKHHSCGAQIFREAAIGVGAGIRVRIGLLHVRAAEGQSTRDIFISLLSVGGFVVNFSVKHMPGAPGVKR